MHFWNEQHNSMELNIEQNVLQKATYTYDDIKRSAEKFTVRVIQDVQGVLDQFVLQIARC